jgi:hypothetical protein
MLQKVQISSTYWALLGINLGDRLTSFVLLCVGASLPAFLPCRLQDLSAHTARMLSYFAFSFALLALLIPESLHEAE